jgi:hypothetical protein
MTTTNNDVADVTGDNSEQRQNTGQFESRCHISCKLIITAGLCPRCDSELPNVQSPRLQKLIEIFLWYTEGHAPNAKRYEEHSLLLCVLHEMESHNYYEEGRCLNWPTRVDVSWIKGQVIGMKTYCASVMVHASANDQFRGAKELLSNGDPDSIEIPPSVLMCLNGRGWLRSAG